MFAKSGKITDFEKTELLDYKEVYCLGLEAANDKVRGKPGKNSYFLKIAVDSCLPRLRVICEQDVHPDNFLRHPIVRT